MLEISSLKLSSKDNTASFVDFINRKPETKQKNLQNSSINIFTVYENAGKRDYKVLHHTFLFHAFQPLVHSICVLNNDKGPWVILLT